MNGNGKTPRALFLEALEIEDAQQRDEFLCRACGPNAVLRGGVDALLKAHTAAGLFMPTQAGPSPVRDALLKSAESLNPDGASNLAGAELPGERIGRYKILEQIGEGGWGVVYLAEQQEPVYRKVALKVIKLGMDTKAVVARFEAERQALALMDHPNIAKVLDAGATETGRPYFVMEFVRGTKITEYCDRKNQLMSARLDLFIQICQAVQHAHQKGIIHRDLKPSNILVSERDGQPAPKVIDFGIAKAAGGMRLTDKTLFTAFEQFIGTPDYMSPEQATFGELDIDTRSDIYSLGVLLYELLTGKTPFDAKALLASGLDEVRRTIQEKEPERPSTRLTTMAKAELTDAASHRSVEAPKLIHMVRGDLDWIVMKCLEKERARRYETANALAQDIRRHLNNEPVMARPPSRLYEFRKGVRRHKFGFAAAGAVMIALAVGALVSTWEVVQKARERRHFQENVIRQYVANGTRLVNEGDLFGSLLWYTEALRLDQGDPAREEPHRIRIASVLQQCPKLLNVFSHGRMLYHSEFSHDGSKVLTSSDDHTACVWDATTGVLLLRLPHDGEVFRAKFSNDDLFIVTSCQDKTARIWDARTGHLLHILRHQDVVWDACFSADSEYVATACGGGTAQVWNAETGQPTGPPLKHEDGVWGIQFSPDGHLLGTASSFANIWDWKACKRIFKEPSVVGCGFSPDGKNFASCHDENLHLWDTTTLKELPFSPIKLANIYSICFSPDSKVIVAATEDSTAMAWNLKSGQALFPQPLRHTGPILAASVSPDCRRIATAGQDTVAQIWSANTGQALGPPLKFIIHVKGAEFNRDGRRLLGVSCDQAARVWDMASSAPFIRQAPIFEDEHRLFSADGRYLLRYGANNVVWLTETESGRKVVGYTNKYPICYVSFSRDDRSVITGCTRRTAVSSMPCDIYLWDTKSGRQINSTPMPHPFALLYAAFSADGNRLLTCGFDFTARLWDAHTGQPLSQPLWHREQIRWGAFSPDGQSAATASWDRTVRVWRSADGHPLTSPLRHKSIVIGASWSADGKRLTTVTEDDSIQVWDLATSDPLTPPLKIEKTSNPHFSETPPSATQQLSQLPIDRRPVTDLVLLAEMLAVGRVDPSGNVVPIQRQELTNDWSVLHEKYPQQFAVTAREAAAWHQHEAQECELEGNITAALSHADWALKNSADDASIRDEHWHLTAMLGLTNLPAPPVSGNQSFPIRDSNTGVNQIDLTSAFNLHLHRFEDNDLGDLGEGLLNLGGVPFDVRGILQLNGQRAKEEDHATFPVCITNISVKGKCRWLHFLQATTFDAQENTLVGKYVLHFADGVQAELPIVFRRDTYEWWRDSELPPGSPGGAVPVWCGNNLKAARYRCFLALSDSVRENPWPHKTLTSIDFISTMSTASPFLVALTLDPGTASGSPVYKPHKASHVVASGGFPTRPAAATSKQVDLSFFYNLTLHRNEAGDFGTLPEGLIALGRVCFDLRGAVCLNSRDGLRNGSEWPKQVTGIPVSQKCKKFHFLQATQWGGGQPGDHVGDYVLHYVDGEMRTLPIVYGRDILGWWLWGLAAAPMLPDNAIPVCTGQNALTRKADGSLWLFKSTRENPRPDVAVSSIDFVSAMADPGPSLAALTVE